MYVESSKRRRPLYLQGRREHAIDLSKVRSYPSTRCKGV